MDNDEGSITKARSDGQWQWHSRKNDKYLLVVIFAGHKWFVIICLLQIQKSSVAVVLICHTIVNKYNSWTEMRWKCSCQFYHHNASRVFQRPTLAFAPITRTHKGLTTAHPKHNRIEFIFLFSIPSIFPLFMPLSLPSITTATKQSNLLISFKFQGSFSHGGSRYCVLLHMRYAISTNFLQSWNFSVTNSKSHLSTGYASHTNHKLTDELNARYIE